MTLLYLAVAFLAGILLGRTAWDTGIIPCAFPGWLWIACMLALPIAPLLNRFLSESDSGSNLRWPTSAGFAAPRRFLSPAVWMAILLCVVAGFTRYAAHPLYPCLDAGDLAYWNAPNAPGAFVAQSQVVAVGIITSYPSARDTTQLVDVAVRQLTVDGVSRPVTGIVRVSAGLSHDLVYGLPVRVQGVLTEPYAGDGGAYRDYLARKGIRSQMQVATVTPLPGELEGNRLLRFLYAVRSRGEDAVNRVLPAPYAALANGMLLGIEAGIPPALMEKFRATGTSHVIVISGSNVALIAGVLAGLFARLMGKRRAWIPVVGGIVAYALLVGGDMAVLRAALMGGLAVVAVGMGRRGSGVITLAAACWLLWMLNPLTVWDVGFQLSAVATAGLIVLTPILARSAAHLWPGWLGGPLSSPYVSASYISDPSGSTDYSRTSGVLRGLFEDSVVVSLAATIAVLPLIAYTFGRVSAVGMLANLLIVPVQPLITIAGSGGALAGALGAALPAKLLLWAAWPGLFWTVQIVDRTARLPFASIAIDGYGLGALAATYMVMVGVIWGRPIVKRLASKDDEAIGKGPGLNWQRLAVRPIALVSAGLVMLLVWWILLSQPDARLHVYFLDVGQGDGVLIETPGGRQVLVDGGSSPQSLLNELGAVMPFWDRSLDMVVLTHADGDHMDAQTQILGRFEVDRAITTQTTIDSDDSVGWQNALERENVAVNLLRSGGWIDLGDGVALWVINPSEGGYIGPDPDNENSLVLKLVYGEFSALLTGDAGLVSEAAWVDADAPITSTVLKVGHHGSKTSTSKPFVDVVNPQIAVIQVGADNRYGHPHDYVLANLAGRTVLRNDVDGRIHIASDGQRIWLETETGDVQLDTTDNAAAAD